MPPFDLESVLSEARQDKSFIDDAITDARYDLLSPAQRQGIERKVRSINPSNIDQTDIDHLVRDQVSKQVHAKPRETREQGIQRRTLANKNAGMGDANASASAVFDQNLSDRFTRNTGGLQGYETDHGYGQRMVDEANKANRDNKASEQSGFWGDTAKELGIGMATMNADVYGLAGHIPGIGKLIQGGMDWVNRQATGMDTEDLYRFNTRRLSRLVSPEMQAAKKKHFWDSERGTLGDAWTDWRTYYSGILESLPEMALTMGPSSMMAKGVFKIALKKSLAKATAAGVEASAARVLAAKAAAKSAERAAYITGAVGEGSLAGAQSERQVRDTILGMNPDALRNSDAMQALMSQGMSFSEAREALAHDQGTQAFVIAGITTGIFGGAGDVMLSKAIRGELAGGLAGRMAKGFVSEGLLEEMPQSVTQQMAQNIALQKANPNQDIMEGVADQALQGAAVGGVMGAGMAALFREHQVSQPSQNPSPTQAAQQPIVQQPIPDQPVTAGATGLDTGPSLEEINAARHAELMAKPAHERSAQEILWLRRYELRGKSNETTRVDAAGGEGRRVEQAGSESPVPGLEAAPDGPVAGGIEGSEHAPAIVADSGEGDGASLTPQEVMQENLPAESVHTETAAHEAASSPLNDLPEPTQAQKEAGNYKVGHLSIAGLNISIENPEGSTRSGVDPNGKAWESTITDAHYGYVRGFGKGRDGDNQDVFVKPGTPQDYDGTVYVIDQKKPGNGHFDETKSMIGYGSEEEARAAYQANYDKGWDGIRAVTPMTMDEFKDWLKNGDHTKPAESKTVQKARTKIPTAETSVQESARTMQDETPAIASGIQTEPAQEGQPTEGVNDEHRTRQPRLQPQGRGTSPSGRMQSGTGQPSGTGRGDDGKPDVAEHRGQHGDGGQGELRNGVAESERPATAVGRQWVHDVIVGLIRRKGIANQSGRRATLDKAVEAAKKYMAGQPVKSSAFELRAKEFDRSNDSETASLLRQIVSGIKAEESASRSTASRARALRPSDNLLVRIRQMGGINMRYRSDVLSDNKGGPVGLFSKNGKGLDDLATELRDEGFPINTDDVGGGVDHLTELIQSALSGRPTYNLHSEKHIQQAMAEQEEIERQANEAVKRVSEEIVEEIDDIPFDEPGNMTPAQVAAILGMDEEEIHGTQGQTEDQVEGAAQEAGQAEPGRSGVGAQTDRQETGSQPNEAGDFSLTGQSASEVKAEEQRKAAQAKQEEKESRKAEQRRKAESEPFVLTGSEREADQAAARGQQDLLAQTAVGSNAVQQTSTNERKATTEERILSEKSPNQLDIHKKPTGWKRIEGQNNDYVTLVSIDGKKAITFKSADTKSGSESVRMNARAQEYAIDNPYSIKQSDPGELEIKALVKKSNDYGAKNSVFTADAAAKARELLKKKLGQINTGIDPELLQAGITLAGYHIEAGARTFAAYAKAMLNDLGDAVKPYLKSWYAAVALDPRTAFLDEFRSDDGKAKFSIVWHGTPHIWAPEPGFPHGRPRLDKIGTGEGAQAYGWGWYSAESRGVGGEYASMLGKRFASAGREIYDAVLSGRHEDYLRERLAAAQGGGMDLFGNQLSDMVGVYEDALRAYQEHGKAIRLAEHDISAVTAAAYPGQIYKLDIPDDVLPHLLDWDKPLSEQTPEVQKALRTFDTEYGEAYPLAHESLSSLETRATTGRALYYALSTDLGSPKKASEDLARIGIVGNRYLDGQSRNRPLKDIKREFLAELPEDADASEVAELIGTGKFSPKNDALLRALRDDDWLGFDYPAQAVSAALSNDLSGYDASPELIRAVADAKEGGTYNYVIWDQPTLDRIALLERNGERLDAIRDAALSRHGRTGSIPIRDAQAIVDIFRASNRNAPPISVLSEVEKAPDALIDQIKAAGASNDVEAAFHDGKIYVFADHIESPERLVHVLTHEGRHFALRAMHGPGLDKILMSIYQSNDKVRSLADKKKSDLGLSSLSDSTEEALVDLTADDLPKLSGWSKLVSFVRLKLREFAAGLRDAGFHELAQAVRDRLGAWTDADVVTMIRNADKFVRSGRGGVASGTAFSHDENMTSDRGAGDNFTDQNPTKPGREVQNSAHARAISDRIQELATDAGLDVAFEDSKAWGSQYLTITDTNESRVLRVRIADHQQRYGGNDIYIDPSPFGNSVEEGIAAIRKVFPEIPLRRKAGTGKAFLKERSEAKERAEMFMLKNATKNGVQPADVYPLVEKIGEATSRAEIAQAYERVIAAASSGSNLAGTPSGADTRLSRNVPRDPVLASALSKSGLGQPKTLKERVQGALNNIIDTIKNDRQYLAAAFRQGAMDQFYGIQLAERQTIGNLPAEQSAYVAARLSTGSSSVMRGLLLHGMARWAANGQHLEKIPDSKGLLEILDPVKDDLNDWLGWMVGNRASRLMEEGKEHNLTREEIAALQALGNGRVAKFSKAAVEFGKFKRSVLDVAQEAGLIDGTTRPVWDRMDWIPFYRTLKEEVRGPFGKRGLSGQRSGIRTLKGGASSINDPLENILMNFNHLIGASLKNNALLRVVENLDGTGMMEKIGYDFRPELIPAGQIKQVLQDNGVPQDMISVMPKEVFEGINKMWSIKEPVDKDVVRVMMGGKPVFFRVHDPLLLRSLTSFTPYTFPGMKMARGFKRVLTSSVTATPPFMMRNFIRDTMSTLIIGKDRASVTGAMRGIVKSYRESGGFEQMLFAGASFAGGYIDAGHPEAAARAIRRSLRAKGMNAASMDEFMSTVIDTPAKFWEKYKELGEAIENANREAIFESTVKAGKSVTDAAYEAKDLMDFSLRGGWAAYQLLADVIPFFNARVQGLYRLGRSDMKSMMLRASVMLILPSIALALANAGDDRYEELPDWDKDTYWHFWVGQHHFRIPKPFEIGAIFATLPERITSTLLGNESPRKLADRVFWNISHQLNLLEWPQIVKPVVEVWANRDTFRDASIETQADQNKLPHLRYNARTSDTMKLLAGLMPETSDATGMSPKRMQHLVNGYLGSMGAYALGIADTAVRIAEGAPDKPSMRLDDYPLLGVIYRADPTVSSQFVEDIYDMANEVNKIHSSVESLKKENKGDEAVALVEKYQDKLMMRGVLEATTERFSKINKAMDQIAASMELTKDEKRKQIDELLATRNEIARESARVVQPAF